MKTYQNECSFCSSNDNLESFGENEKICAKCLATYGIYPTTENREQKIRELKIDFDKRFKRIWENVIKQWESGEKEDENMQFLNNLLESALIAVLEKKKWELFDNIKINIEYKDLEKLMRIKTVYIVSCISKILEKDTDDFEAIENIVKLFEDNNIYSGSRHDF